MTRRLAAALLAVTLSGVVVTGCEPDPSTGSCAHAASTKATSEDEFWGVTQPMAETYVWVRWVASTSCSLPPMWWTNWDWHTYAWWYAFGYPSTNTVEGSGWQDVYDHWRSSAVTALDQAEFVSDGDHYRQTSRVYVGSDGWIYWSCGRVDLNGGGQTGWTTCEWGHDY